MRVGSGVLLGLAMLALGCSDDAAAPLESEIIPANEEITAYIDPGMQVGCLRALYGRCFHGEQVALDPEWIFDDFEAQLWCEDKMSVLECGVTECVDRVRVLAGLAVRQLSGNPCLPT